MLRITQGPMLAVTVTSNTSVIKSVRPYCASSRNHLERIIEFFVHLLPFNNAARDIMINDSGFLHL